MIFRKIKHWFGTRLDTQEMETTVTLNTSSSSVINDQPGLSDNEESQWMESADAAFDKGDYQTAGEYYLKVIRDTDTNSNALYRYAKSLFRQGRLEEAAEYFNKVLWIQHDSHASYYYLGKIDKRQGKYSSASDHYNMAIHFNPDFIPAYIGLGDTQIKSGAKQEAVRNYKRALDRCKEPSARTKILDAIATIHYQDREYAEAVRFWKEAIGHDENNVMCLQNIGITLNDMGCFEEAETYIRKAYILDDSNADILLNLSWSLLSQSRFDEASEYCHKALVLEPENELVNNQYARILIYTGQEEAALSFYHSLIARHPEFMSTQRNMAFLELRLGRLGDGWRHYEVRKAIKNWKGVGGIPSPASGDVEFSGRNVLILPEQGIGDEIMFSSCLPDLENKVANVTVCCDNRLVSIFQRSFPGVTVYGSDRGNRLHIDGTTPEIQELVGSLPLYFRPDIESFPDHAGYLVADEDNKTRWQQRLSHLGSGPKIGIAWRSRLATGNREGNYIRLSDWGPILAVPGAHFVNLQYDECADELTEAQRSCGVKITDFMDLDQFNDIDGVAALMSTLDLVIAVGTSVAELAGALGCPVWKLQRTRSWPMLGTDHSPWYPATRMFIPQAGADWSGVIGHVGSLLRDFVDEWPTVEQGKQGP